MWKTLVGKFQPLPASSYNDSNNERDLERTWDERDTTGLAGIPENATSQEELQQYVLFSFSFSFYFFYFPMLPWAL